MTDVKKLEDEIAGLRREVAELNGLALATGVILTQLLQTNCYRERNPQQAAGKIMTAAREGVENFTSAAKSDPAMKKRALQAVDQYEEQIRAALAV